MRETQNIISARLQKAWCTFYIIEIMTVEQNATRR